MWKAGPLASLIALIVCDYLHVCTRLSNMNTQYRSWAKCFGGPNLAEQNLGESGEKNPENF